MIHTVYTRQRYDDGPFQERMELALETCIPAMVAAAAKCQHPVRWAWRAHPHHAESLVDTVRAGGWKGELEVLEEFGPFGDVQSTLDSDDRIEPHFLHRVQLCHRPGAPFVVTWQPIKQRLSDGAKFAHRMKYQAYKPSNFYAVYNPTAAVHVYARKHGEMHLLGAPCRVAGDRGAIVVIHAGNPNQTINGRDERIR